jgi:hypothetical protein
MRSLVMLAVGLGVACGGTDDVATPDDSAVTPETVEATDTATSPADSALPGDTATSDTAVPGDSAFADADAALPTINVDYTAPKRHDFTFKANEADPAANESLGTQGAYLDTRVKAKGKLIVYLHGAGDSAPTSCTQGELANVVTAWGFHLITPCYNSYYGVSTCGTDIGGCRLEAFEGIDHTKAIDIKPANAIEPRVVAALKYLQAKHPGGDWKYFLDGDKPRWSEIIISGISHGASSAALIGVYRNVSRVVSLSGPLDTKQAWLSKTPLTPVDGFYGFTHTADDQHPGHLEAFAALKFPGAVVSVDGAMPPYSSSHRLKTSAPTSNGHSSPSRAASRRRPAGSTRSCPFGSTCTEADSAHAHTQRGLARAAGAERMVEGDRHGGRDDVHVERLDHVRDAIRHRERHGAVREGRRDDDRGRARSGTMELFEERLRVTV